MATNLATKERNGTLYALCPTCSRHYQIEDDAVTKEAAHELPSRCRRCGGPMDAAKAVSYGEELAHKDHRADLTAVGERMRAASGAAPLVPH